MIFTETKLKGAFLIDLDRLEDERGFFALSWSAHEFARYGLSSCLVECNVSFNKTKGTLRGMHYQVAPCGQAKLVRCTKGAIYDVALDLRPGSPTFRSWVAAAMSANYGPEYAGGLRWDDPALAIQWPETENRIISERDRTYSLLLA